QPLLRAGVDRWTRARRAARSRGARSQRGLRVRERLARAVARAARDETLARERALRSARLVRTHDERRRCPHRGGDLAENISRAALTRVGRSHLRTTREEFAVPSLTDDAHAGGMTSSSTHGDHASELENRA